MAKYSTELVYGSYSSVKDEKSVEYFKKTGIPADKAEGMKGTHWRMDIKDANGKFLGRISCDEMPAMCNVETFTEGEEKEVDSLIFGGKAKVSFVSTGPNKFLTTIKSSLLGCQEVQESYTTEGLTATTTHKESGAVITEFWPRQFNETGWFKKVKEENFGEYMKAQGVPMDGMEGASHHMHLCDGAGGARTQTEITAGISNSFTFKLDEETDYKYSLGPSLTYNRRTLVTKVGPGHYKYLAKEDKTGGDEEWDLQFDSNGLIWTGLDNNTGTSCKLFMERFTNICGKFRVVAVNGFTPFGQALGMPSEMITQVEQDREAVLTISQKDGCYTTHFDSKFMPVKTTSRMNEEYTITVPGIPGEYKCLDTMCGNTIMNVARGPKVTTSSECIFTDNFLVQESKIVGTDISSKTIMERIG